MTRRLLTELGFLSLMRRMWSQVGRLLGACAILSAVGTAGAQTLTPSAPAPPPAAPGGQQPSGTAPAPLEAAPVSAACFPNCRTSFTCHQGQCISLCNPLCPQGQRCLPDGECAPEATVAPAPTPPPTPAPAPVVVAPPAPVAEPRKDAASVEPSALRAPGRFVFVAHLGLELYGLGRADDEVCGGGKCTGRLGSDFVDKSPVVLGFDGLLHASRGLRLGLGYWVIPRSALGAEPNKATTIHIGSEHELNAIMEGVVPLRPSLALTLRAQAGLHVLVSGGKLADSLESFLRTCMERPVDHCEVDKGPFLGAQFGTTVGLLFGDRVRGRVDLGVERYFVAAGERRVLDGAFEQSSTSHHVGTRIWALTGLEL